MRDRRRGLRLLLAAVVSALAGCSFFSCDEPIEKERKELAKASEAVELVLYRGLKVSIRSAPMKEVHESGAEIAKLTTHILSKVSRAVDSDEETPALTPMEYLTVAKEFYQLRHALRETDEDQFPTILDNALALSGKERNPEALLLRFYTSSHEHFVLAVAWLAIRQAPRSFRVYETGKIKTAELDPLFRQGALLLRGATFLTEGWPYMADEELTAYLDELEKNRAVLLLVSGAVKKDASEDQVYAGLHAPGVLLRGFCRLQKKEKEAALEDFDAFLTDADTLGLDDELVWLVGTYVSLSRGDQEKALVYLRKLEKSKIWNDKQRKLIRNSIEAVEARTPDSALAMVTDKIIITKLVVGYVIDELSEVEWRKELEKTETGRRMVGIGDTLNGEVDRLRNAFGKGQVEKMSGQATKKVKDLWRRTRGSTATSTN